MVLIKNIINIKFIEFLLIILPIALLFSVVIAETIVVLIILSYCLFSNKNDFIKSIKDPILFLLIIFWLYLFINFFINYENSPSFSRTLFFGRFILLIISINFLINNLEINIKKIFKYWLLILIIISFDLFIQFYTQKNILGFEAHKLSKDIFRLSGFMNDELKIANLIYNFGLLAFTYFFFNTQKYSLHKYNYLLLILIILTIFITAERAHFVSSIFFLIFFILFGGFNFKKLTVFLSGLLILMSIFVYKNKELSNRMIFEINDKASILKEEPGKSYLYKDNRYFAHYSVAFQIFKDNQYFGVGLKNFRKFCNNDEFNKDIFPGWRDRKCSTHPHNFYFEIISEIGGIGLFLILCFFIFSFFRFLKVFSISRDKFLLFNLFIILIYFVPFIPRGSFFNNWNAIIFWVIFSILYSSYNKLKKISD